MIIKDWSVREIFWERFSIIRLVQEEYSVLEMRRYCLQEGIVNRSEFFRKLDELWVFREKVKIG